MFISHLEDLPQRSSSPLSKAGLWDQKNMVLWPIVSFCPANGQSRIALVAIRRQLFWLLGPPKRHDQTISPIYTLQP